MTESFMTRENRGWRLSKRHRSKKGRQMLSLIADALMNATRNKHYDPHKDWADRFVPKYRRKSEDDRYKYNPYRDLW